MLPGDISKQKNPLQTAIKTNQKAALITSKGKKMHHSAMKNAGAYGRT